MAQRLHDMRGHGMSGIRTLFAGDLGAKSLAEEAASLGNALAAKGQTVILIDWAPFGDGIAAALKHASAPGMLELVAGKAKFDEVMGALAHGGAHFIPAGESLVPGTVLDPNRVNFVLDALDDVYDQIVVVSREDSARHLLEAIEGRFDCGITVTAAGGRSAIGEGLETFLGYEVDGIELMRYVAISAQSAGRSIRNEPRQRTG
jgi:hypothetical protein